MNKSIVLAGGCFWCVEAVFNRVNGVASAISGYANGDSESAPSYEQVCTGRTGFAEACRVTFDTEIISLQDILLIFFTTHNPTTLNRQGADAGTQYRSGIYYDNASDVETIHAVIAQVQDEAWYADPIVTEVTLLTHFFEAEAYHQHYFEQNPHAGYCQIVINPKIAKLKQSFAHLYKSEA